MVTPYPRMIILSATCVATDATAMPAMGGSTCGAQGSDASARAASARTDTGLLPSAARRLARSQVCWQSIWAGLRGDLSSRWSLTDGQLAAVRPTPNRCENIAGVQTRSVNLPQLSAKCPAVTLHR